MIISMLLLVASLHAAEPQHTIVNPQSAAGTAAINRNFRNAANEIRRIPADILAGDNTFTGSNTFDAGISSSFYDITGSTPSTIVADRIYKPSIIRAFVRFDNTATVVVKGSFNVSSIGDAGTGDYEIFWDLDFPNVTYVAICSAGNETAQASVCSVGNYAGGSVTYDSFNNSNSPSNLENNMVIATAPE